MNKYKVCYDALIINWDTCVDELLNHIVSWSLLLPAPTIVLLLDTQQNNRSLTFILAVLATFFWVVIYSYYRKLEEEQYPFGAASHDKFVTG